MTAAPQEASSYKTAIRPFQVGFPEADLTDLLRRIHATRWPDRETVTDDSQGVRLAMMHSAVLSISGKTLSLIGWIAGTTVFHFVPSHWTSEMPL